ncbi:MAG: Fe-S biogenesis protein NfuA [Psychrosphaera sp.]|nr:Fe-S biogenesis protein NfuA [Psychrosphaera sp.]
MDIQLNITESAQEYLSGLLAKQATENMSVRMFVTQPGTKYAETCLAYCKPGEEKEDDKSVELSNLHVYLDRKCLPYLDEAEVDYASDRMGGQLTIKAPNAKMKKIQDDAPLLERINYVIDTEINPQLANHGGNCLVPEVTEDKIDIVQFGGGCNGCSQIDMTLKEGIEKELLAKFEDEINGVRDATEHQAGEHSYY